jgi:hypothetical protein
LVVASIWAGAARRSSGFAPIAAHTIRHPDPPIGGYLISYPATMVTFGHLVDLSGQPDVQYGMPAGGSGCGEVLVMRVRAAPPDAHSWQ